MATFQTIRVSKQRLFAKIVTLATCLLLFCQLAQAASSFTNPYAVLGVDRTDSDAVIKKRYHKLCLKYHPDKQTDKSLGEQKRLEEKFKKIQAAYSQINSAPNRWRYDATSSMNNVFDTSAYSEQLNDLFRKYQSHSFGYFHHNMKNNNNDSFSSFSGTPWSSIFPQSSSFGRVFYQEDVTVPLATLYQGGVSIEHTIQTNIVRRAIASFRGGVAYPILCNSIWYALPFGRLLGRRVAILIWLTIFLSRLPQPSTTTFTVPIQAGYKPGTKIYFQSNPGKDSEKDILLTLRAKRHGKFRLVRNDLHTTLRITQREATKGCLKKIPRLVERGDETQLTIQLPANTFHNDEFILPGEGWPIRTRKDGNTKAFGNLVVHVRVESAMAPTDSWNDERDGRRSSFSFEL
jgi:DnaJ-class molecular chaperone